MFSQLLSFVLVASSFSAAFAAPVRREVPQEHSHEKFIVDMRRVLFPNNPAGFQDPIFPLLGNAAAAQGLGSTSDVVCLQQAVADQAFSNAKANNDVNGMVTALVYRTLERNTGRVGQTSDICDTPAVNPEIDALQQHQDPASNGAAALNKEITLELARQIAAVGGDPLIAIESGTFAPGDVNDPTGAGNTCDDLDDPVGCIFTKNLLVPDATPEEIQAAVAGAGGGNNDNGDNNNNDDNNNNGGENNEAGCGPATVTVTAAAPAATATAPAENNNNNNDNNNTGGNLQKFTGALGGESAPAVTPGGRGFQVAGSDDFLNLGAAIGRSCDIQKNRCANVANSAAGRSSGLTVGQCDQQNGQCRAANGN